MAYIRRMPRFLAVLLLIAALVGGAFLSLSLGSWGCHREQDSSEQALRSQVVAAAEAWLGLNEADGSHRQIIDIYNGHMPLAQNYTVTYEDNWCAAFVSAVAIQCGLTDIVPTECGCQRQISLWQNLERWEEDDNYIPLPGDLIYYAWDEKFTLGDCTGWADHVGIVIGTNGPFIKVIEGNKDDCVTYRIIPIGYWQIRGYGLPDYESKA